MEKTDEVKVVNGMVRLRGIDFPVEVIVNAMAETGGIAVSQEELNKELDKARKLHEDRTGVAAESIHVEIIPGWYFVPQRIKLHSATSPGGTPINKYLYFAVRRKY